MSMTYEEWRNRSGIAGPAESTDKLLRRAYRLLQEWNNLNREQSWNVHKQKSGEYTKDDPCWEESITGATMNFCNWGV